jgi:hypothetical protein
MLRNVQNVLHRYDPKLIPFKAFHKEREYKIQLFEI